MRFYSILSYPIILPYPTLPYPILSHPILVLRSQIWYQDKFKQDFSLQMHYVCVGTKWNKTESPISQNHKINYYSSVETKSSKTLSFLLSWDTGTRLCGVYEDSHSRFFSNISNRENSDT